MRDISRREAIALGTLTFAGLWAGEAVGQVLPFSLTLRRDRNLATTLSLNDCITGRLYITNPGLRRFPTGPIVSDEIFLCDTLELPFRNELNEISCIRPGTYGGSIREDGDRGWRIQLTGTKQLAIQIHPGNVTANTHGCILVGTRVSGQPCTVINSRLMMTRIRDSFGTNNNRSIELIVSA